MTDLETQVKRALELWRDYSDLKITSLDFEAHCNPAFVKALCESWLELRTKLNHEAYIGDKARSERNIAETERDTLRAQVEKMRAVMGNVKPLLTRFLILLEGGFDAREACLTFEAIQEAMREIDEAMK